MRNLNPALLLQSCQLRLISGTRNQQREGRPPLAKRISRREGRKKGSPGCQTASYASTVAELPAVSSRAMVARTSTSVMITLVK